MWLNDDTIQDDVQPSPEPPFNPPSTIPQPSLNPRDELRLTYLFWVKMHKSVTNKGFTSL